MHTRSIYLSKLADFAFKPLIKVLSGMRRVGKSTLLKLHAEALRQRFPDLVLLEIDKESMGWDHIRTGRDLYAAARAEVAPKSGPVVLSKTAY